LRYGGVEYSLSTHNPDTIINKSKGSTLFEEGRIYMTREEEQKFSDKHGPNAQALPGATEQIQKSAKNGSITCAAAHRIAAELKLPPAEIGKAIDLLDYRISKCQIGLFGYGHGPDKKVVEPKAPENQQLEKALRETLVDEKLSCHDAWDIASRFKTPKMTISSACEALGIKIKPCQLGAF
jgi:hypothetical protein